VFSQNDELNSRKFKRRKNRTRVRQVDFMRVEDTAHGQELAPFELEVKEEIARNRNPFEEIESQETQAREVQLKRVARYKLSCLMRSAQLTQRQRECYQLIWVKGLSENEAARKLGLSRSRVRDIKKTIKSSLVAAHEEEKHRKGISLKIQSVCKTAKHRTVCKLYFKKGKTVSEISRCLGVSRQAVQQLLKRLLKTA